jgi:prefoldin subunit 5
VGGIALDARGAEPRGLVTASAPVEVATAEVASVEELAASADELQELLALLEVEYAAIAADPRLASAPERIRESASAIGAQIQSLRATSARLDALLAEGSQEER